MTEDFWRSARESSMMTMYAITKITLLKNKIEVSRQVPVVEC
jgi:hypothetical protein